ncbi:MAG: HAMP domain-containing histidine kinase [Geminicoccaceae bacterium]|nr:HAMP domain-containing histidine kinase [Geminicoccaceae bacterium]
MAETAFRPRLGRGLSARILLLTCLFVLLGEVLIYLPSIARFRLVFLEERLAAAELAALALDAAPEGRLDPALEGRLLRYAGVSAVTLWRNGAELMLGRIQPVDRVVDLAERTPWRLVRDALAVLVAEPDRRLRVVVPSPREPGTVIDVIVPEAPLRAAMLDYSRRIVTLSVFLSLLVAVLLVASLWRLVVRPLRVLTARLERFRLRPEEPEPEPGNPRGDELGIVEAELVRMRAGLRQALAEKTRLAALGAAVSELAHDLKNMLASAVLVSDRLEKSADPAVRQIAPRLVASLDRAIRLCTDTLAFARDRPRPPRLERFPFAPLVEEVRSEALAGAANLGFATEIPPGLEVEADRDHLHRVLANLLRNAREALEGRAGTIRLSARSREGAVSIAVEDDGPGVPEAVRARLFTSFARSGKPQGSGLGLAICRELLRAQGGDISLARTGPDGTMFEVTLPVRGPTRALDRRAAE